MLSIQDDFIHAGYLHWSWLRKYLQSTTDYRKGIITGFRLDYFINTCFLWKMSSSMQVIYLRWLHQCLLSTIDYFFNTCFLWKMISLVQAFYLCHDFINNWYLHKMTLFTACFPCKMTSSMQAIYLTFDFLKAYYL